MFRRISAQEFTSELQSKLLEVEESNREEALMITNLIKVSHARVYRGALFEALKHFDTYMAPIMVAFLLTIVAGLSGFVQGADQFFAVGFLSGLATLLAYLKDKVVVSVGLNTPTLSLQEGFTLEFHSYLGKSWLSSTITRVSLRK